MKFTDKEEKIARLALDKGAKNGERQAAAIKLIESLYARGIKTEDLEGTETIDQDNSVYRDIPVYVDITPKNDWEHFLTNIKITASIGALWGLVTAILAICRVLAGYP